MDGMHSNRLPREAANIGLAQCHLDNDSDMAMREAWQLLSVDEATRARRFHFDRDRDRYVRRRGFLRRVLGQFCGQAPAGLVFGTGPRGKPFLPGRSLFFNLSHSKGLAVLAVSQTGPLGIDLEFIDRRADIAGLAQTCLTAKEAAILQELPKASRAAQFFTFWTAKEACMKLTGEGMSLPPRQIVLDLSGGMPVGYIYPVTVQAQAVFLDLGHPAAMCCLALGQGPKPIVAPLY